MIVLFFPSFFCIFFLFFFSPRFLILNQDCGNAAGWCRGKARVVLAHYDRGVTAAEPPASAGEDVYFMANSLLIAHKCHNSWSKYQGVQIECGTCQSILKARVRTGGPVRKAAVKSLSAGSGTSVTGFRWEEVFYSSEASDADVFWPWRCD